MSQLIELTPTKTYASMATLERAVAKLEVHQAFTNVHLRFLVQKTKDGRFYPVFVGINLIDVAHFGFCVVA